MKTCRWHRDSKCEHEVRGVLLSADLQYHRAASSSAQEGDGTLWYMVVYIDLLTRLKKHSLLWGIV